MSKQFNFHSLPSASSRSATEANIFIHGYSAGHNATDRQILADSIPETIKHYLNIFAFWPSSHFGRFNSASLKLLTASAHTHWAAVPAVLATDRAAHFWRIRSRAEDMGEVLLGQLSEHLRVWHPKIDTINLIGHSLGGRLVISSLKTFTSTSLHRFSINDVLLMAAAVKVEPVEAKQISNLLKGRLINAYSKEDWTLLMNLDETCLGRNQVAHFENIQIGEFGHGDYWKKFAEVLHLTEFKSPVKTPWSKEEALAACAQAPLYDSQDNEPTLDEQSMTFNLNTPADIYQRVNEALGKILGSLTGPSTDAALNQAQNEARELLTQHQTALQTQLAELKKNAEWNTFTIAFYGETGAGKSTIIETLRILLQEPGKLASQQKFRELQHQYGLREESLQQFQTAIEQGDAQLTELAQQLSATLQHHEQLHSDALNAFEQNDVRLAEVTQQLRATLQQHEQLHAEALNAIGRLQALIAERKQSASFWQKLLNLFRSMPEDVELTREEQQLPGVAAARDNAGTLLLAQQRAAEQSKFALEQQLSDIATARDNASAALLGQQAEAKQHKCTLTQQQQESQSHLAQLLAELEQRADGEIIGDGRADFTRQTQRYNFELDGQPFALLDVPGIEGNEGLIHSEIEQAVQTAHAVFYVTNQAAPPQTGDEQRKGTLEKIKAHLGAQTEVWTIFNKKITNPKHALTGRPLTSDDENISLGGLNEKMREQLGEHYREVFPLTALSAFLASTDHFAPNSQNAQRRNKILADFNAEELLEKSRLRTFLQLLGSQLLNGSKGKINRANFHKANAALGQTTTTLGGIQDTFAKLSEKLQLDGQSAKVQLNGSFSALKTRLEATGQRQIDDFASNVRNSMYGLIDDDISNDYFKDALKDRIGTQQENLSKQLPAAMAKDVEHFQKDAGDILKRFEEQARELSDIYAKLNSTQLNGKFNLKLDLDNGLKATNLLAVLAGGALLFWNPAGWVLMALGASGLVFGAYKAVRDFFSSDYKKAQQRKSTEDNLSRVTEQLRKSLHDGLKSALPDMQKKIGQLEQALEAPAKKTAALVQLLSQSSSQLKALSRQINNAGNL